MPVIKIRRGTTTQWNASSRVLQVGELGIDTTLNRIKAGNGTNVWSALPYLSLSSAEIEELSQDAVSTALAAGTHSNITVTYSDNGNSISLATGPDVITQTSLSNTLTNATTGYVPIADVGSADGVASLDSNGKIPLTELGNLIDGAPNALNTLNELAAAINDDSSYASTITTSLGNKQDKVSGVSDTEISYLDGVTSSIQTQLDGKVDESLFDTKGDLLVASADNTPAKLPAGTNGYLLTANSSATNGIEWAAAPVSLPDQTGNSGEYLTTNGTTASWAEIPVTSAATPTARGTVFGRTGTLYNVSLGENALPALTTGAANIAIGDFSQSATTDQISNIGIGYNTLIDLAEDSNLNVAIGTNALGGAGTLDGSNNVAIGGNSGYGGLTGSNNLLLGANAAPSSSTVSNEITLGNSSITSFRIPGLGIEWQSNPDIMNIMEAW